jgi:cation-transporting ATPase 13A3/4/5
VPSSRYYPLIQRMLVYKSTRFIYDDDMDVFVRLKSPKEYALGHLKDLSRRGLEPGTHRALLDLFGRNALAVRVPTYAELFMTEVMHPFFVFQIYSILLWCCEKYYIFATCIFFMAAFSVVLTLIDTKRALSRLQHLAACDVPVQVIRNGVQQSVSSLSLVPGDLLVVERGPMVCDALIVRGRALVNEAVLTGESAPVNKASIDMESIKARNPRAAGNQDSGLKNRFSQSSQRPSGSSIPDDFPVVVGVDEHTLHAATEVLQVRGRDQVKGKCLAVVTNTGFDTSKGALLLSLLYPLPSTFEFMQQALRFTMLLFAVAMVGFGLSVYTFLQFGAPWSLILIRSFDLITIVVPPSLPLAMAVGTNNALQRLREIGIFCSQPSRVNVAGK